MAKVRAVRGPDGLYVIRWEPTEVKTSVWTLGTNPRSTIQEWRRLFTGDQRWTVLVFSAENDPLGPDFYRETVNSQRELGRAVATIEKSIRDGSLSNLRRPTD